jgi:hypothetical protein
VLKENKKQGLMETIRLIPLFKDLSVTRLQRLCELVREETVPKGQTVGSLQARPDWILCVVLSGKLKLKAAKEGSEASQKHKKRGENSFVLAKEIETLGVSVVSDSDDTRLALIPVDAYDEVMGDEGQVVLQEELVSPRGKPRQLLARQQSMFSKESNLAMKVLNSKNQYTMDAALIALGDFAYIGNFKKGSKGVVSVKVIAKKRAAECKMDSRLLQERQFIVALKSMACPCIVSMSSVFQDQRIVMLEYDDLIMCDLALAIANNALSTPEAKIYYAACIYLGLSKVHESGLMHRFINSGSVYISSIGVPKVKQTFFLSIYRLFKPAAALISIVRRPPVLQEDGWPKSFHHLRRPVVFCTRDRQSARI